MSNLAKIGGAFLVGVLVTVICLHAYSVYQTRSWALGARQQSEINRQNIEQIVEFINTQQQRLPVQNSSN